MNPNQKTAIITGGTAGIGYGIAKVFAQNGINLVLSYFHNEKRANDVGKELSNIGVKVITIKSDSGSNDDLKNLFEEAKKIFGKIEILVNNIGSTYPDAYNENEWESMFYHHMMGTVNGTELFKDQLGEESGGSIINISSVAGIEPLLLYRGARLEAYCCIKSAINTYTKIAANKFSGKIRVNCIAPGNVESEGWKGADEKFKEARIKGMLIHRFIEPTEIGKMAFQIVDNNALNGQIFIVDGGVVGKGYE